MTDGDLFRYIRHKSDYVTLKGDFQYKVEVSDKDKQVLCIFEETSGKRDWFVNFWFFPRRWKGKMFLFHGGYLRTYSMNAEAVMSDLLGRMNEHPDYEPLFCGWSAGGGYAHIAAFDYAMRTGKRGTVVSFGSPKVLFGKESTRCLRKLTLNIREYVAVGDIPPFCPPFPGFHHANPISLGKFPGIIKMLRNAPEIHESYAKLLDDKFYEE